MEEKKTYKFGELEFTLKNLRIAGVRKNALKLIAKYRKVITESNDPLEGLIEMFYPDVEMPLIENGVIQKNEDGTDKTIIEVQPQFKYIFESILDGDLNKIDYDNLIECEKLGRECLFDFFMQSKGLLGV